MSNYVTLVKILDQLRKEAPPQYKSYYPLETETEKLNQARSKAFIHLYLKVIFGLLDFDSRVKYVTDDIDDGGIDGYYIDEENKMVFFIQSKFRTSETGFNEKEIQLQEILRVDADRIVKGETCYENGKPYNGKIQNLIKHIQSINDIALYKHQVVVLANLKKVTESQLKKLVGGLPGEIINFDRCYKELLFPVVSGTYYSATDVYVSLDLTQKSLGSRIRYMVDTEFRDCEITVVFVPTIEIAKIMHKYKNSILKFNPRSYLDLSKNPVNSQIAKTIRDRKTNEFALFNNGITVLSDQTFLQEQTGYKNIAQLKLTNPQIINGGQTAYTLCKLYEDGLNSGSPDKLFEDKEVLMKVITFTDVQAEDEKKYEMIEAISRATNQQTAVTEADRKSNDKAQIGLQAIIFDDFGLFYERKRGEFWNGLNDGYVDKSNIIDRELFLRICVACNRFPAEARGSSETDLFKDERLYSTLCNYQNTRLYYFGYICYDALNQIQKRFRRDRRNRYGVINYGNALRYGKFAVVSVCCNDFNSGMNGEELAGDVNTVVEAYLSKWLAFEQYISKLKSNEDYFVPIADIESGTIRYEMNYSNYYKGRTLNTDLSNYFRG